jgi:lipopolysaccharide export system permease protein
MRKPAMLRLSLYVLRQLLGPIALFTFLLTIVVWLSQSPRMLDLIINRGQSAPTFLYLMLLLLPSLLVIILPIAFLAGALYSLHKLNTDSELVVMWSSGYSRMQLAVPVFAAAAIIAALTYLCALYLMPLGQRVMKDKVFDIRADIGAAVLNEGQFNTPADGLTVFIRELSSDGRIRGVLVHDNRNKRRPISYLAESGELVQTSAGPRLIMEDGTIEQTGAKGTDLSVLKFKRYVFDINQFAGKQRQAERETDERFLPELLWPQLKSDPNNKVRNIFLAEANNRLSAPLYCFVFALIALAAVTRGRRGRSAYALRLTVAALAASAMRIAGYGVAGLAARHPELNVLFYMVPVVGAAAAIADMMGLDPGELLQRRHRETAT